MKKITALVLLMLLTIAWSVSAEENDITVSTCQDFLKQMKLPIKKADQNRLTFETGFPEGKKYGFLLVADEKNKFVYLAVTDLLKLDPEDPKACETAKKLAAMNYGMVMTKLEWNEQGKEVRLSATLGTEDGLSLKRFANTITTLLLIAEQVEPKLK